MDAVRHPFVHRLFAVAAFLIAAFAIAGSEQARAQSFEQQVVELVNLARWDHGRLPPMKHEPLLDVSSEAHSAAMAQRNFFAHCDLDTGSMPWTRMAAAGYAYSSAAENIAAGYATPTQVMSSWMNSAGHRANILGSRREIGVGYVEDPGDAAGIRLDQNGDCAADGATSHGYGRYWTQNFGTRSGTDPVVIDREAYSTATCDVAVHVYNSIGATEMRFSNDGIAWSNWVSFASDASWRLAGALGATATVHVEIRAGATVRRARDEILLAASCSNAGAEPAVFAHGFE